MKKLQYTYSRRRLFSGYDGKFCKVAPHLAFDGEQTALLSYQMLLLTGSDVFYGQYVARSTDGGKTFSEPVLQEALKDRYENGVRYTASGFPCYNRHHKKWFGLGHRGSFADDKQPICRGGISITDPLYFSLDGETGCFTGYRPLPFPVPYISAVTGAQLIELENGDILVPFYYTTEDFVRARCLTVRYAFDGDELKIVGWGDPVDGGEGHARGLCEPSLARLNGKYYMTIRTDEVGLYAVSEDGCHFSEPIPWAWEDGSVLENYNTQQHWICHPEGLFLAYTRKGAHNDHVFRHRAPIFMARFDEERGCLIRESEIILVPELGARLGNFAVTEASEKEAWLITAEWMQPRGCEKYGSDNSLWHACIEWK